MVAIKNSHRKNNEAWWAYSPVHGWVVLDRSLPHNKCTDMPEFLEFIRCRDGLRYEQADQPWTYRAADRYLNSLGQAEALKASRELETYQADFEACMAA